MIILDGIDFQIERAEMFKKLIEGLATESERLDQETMSMERLIDSLEKDVETELLNTIF